MNPTLLELAKLDYDMVQAVHIEDLKHASRYVMFSTSCVPKLIYFVITCYIHL